MGKKVLSIEFGVWWSKVALIETGKKNSNVLEMFYFQTPEGVIEDGLIRDKDELANVLKTELATRKIKETSVVFCINSSKVITREVRVPFLKESQIPKLIQSQAKEFFPMDVSNYTIVYNHMGDASIDPKKEMKMQLIAVPDALLTNYVHFAQENGFEILSFEYIGHTIPAFINTINKEPSVVVQLEEQTTVISVLEEGKLAFQRVTPYGYGSSLAAVLEHPILGAKDEHQAFAFLLKHDVLHDDFSLEEFKELQRKEEEEEEKRLQEQEKQQEPSDYVAPIPPFGVDSYRNSYYQEAVYQQKEEIDPEEEYERETSRRRRKHRTPEDEELYNQLMEAQDDIRESLSYHLRVVASALDYYKGQTKREFHGTLHTLGDGVRFGGVKEMFLFELSLEHAKENYFQTIRFSKGAANKVKENEAEGCISVIQAPVSNLKILPKELKSKSGKKNSLYFAKILFASSLLLSAIMVLAGSVQKMLATSKQAELKQQLASLNYIQSVYGEHSQSQTVASAFTAFAESTISPNEQFPELLQAMEEKIPSSVTVQTLTVEEGMITMSATSDKKLTTAELLIRLQEIPLLSKISIPAITKGEDAKGNPVWSFSMTAFYSSAVLQEEGTTDTDATEEDSLEETAVNESNGEEQS